MTAVGHVVRVAGIEHQAVNSFVHGPVELQSRLASTQGAVAVACQLFLRQLVVPDTHLRDVAPKGVRAGDTRGTSYGEGVESSGCLRLQARLCGVAYRHRVAAVSMD